MEFLATILICFSKTINQETSLTIIITHILTCIIGIVIGIIIMYFIRASKKSEDEMIIAMAVSQAFLQKKEEMQNIINSLRDAFGSLSNDALSKNTQNFLSIANERFSQDKKSYEQSLEEKKKLVDNTFQSMKVELEKVENLLQSIEKDREQKFGQLSNQLKFTAEETQKLQGTTQKLQAILANTKIRGQWGERMADDILQQMGMIDGVNYLKQKTQESNLKRPDFTFLLPRGYKIHMDVKFPLDHYLYYHNADTQEQKLFHRDEFLKSVKMRMKEILSKDYINPQENTLDFVLVFLPSDQVYSFIFEHDKDILDTALKNKVVLCSPFTLFAILSIIRQAMENFSVEQKASQIFTLFSSFYKEWNKFIESFDKIGKKLDEAKYEYDSLLTTRKSKLEKQLKNIQELQLLSDDTHITDS